MVVALMAQLANHALEVEGTEINIFPRLILGMLIFIKLLQIEPHDK
jgi:hypothetical protein